MPVFSTGVCSSPEATTGFDVSEIKTWVWVAIGSVIGILGGIAGGQLFTGVVAGVILGLVFAYAYKHPEEYD